MSDILLNDSGDLDITNAALSLTSGKVATKQRLAQRLKLFLNEWFLQQDRGIPYFTQVFVKRPNPVTIDALFKREIASDPAVREITFFELDLNESLRELTVTFKVLTNDGPIDFSEIIVA